MIEGFSATERKRIREYIRENPSSGAPAVLGRFVLDPDTADQVRHLISREQPLSENDLEPPRCHVCDSMLLSTPYRDNLRCPDCEELRVTDDE